MILKVKDWIKARKVQAKLDELAEAMKFWKPITGHGFGTIPSLDLEPVEEMTIDMKTKDTPEGKLFYLDYKYESK